MCRFADSVSSQLSSDYIGNTIIQKLFERCSPNLRYSMLERIAPHLAVIGVHKNGTWAAQKVIECSVVPEERNLIISHLRPFAPPLMCDSLGNYVCAGTLKFGGPWSDYVFDAMMDRMWDIAQNRFGARCMRTCLESPHTSLYQRVSLVPSPNCITIDDIAETNRNWNHPELDTSCNKPQRCSTTHLASRSIQLARPVWSSRQPLCPTHRPPLHPQIGVSDCSEE